jgi:hypothetical protein
MSENINITDEQRQVASALIAEGMKIERERILKIVNANQSKTISINKLNKLISGE